MQHVSNPPGKGILADGKMRLKIAGQELSVSIPTLVRLRYSLITSTTQMFLFLGNDKSSDGGQMFTLLRLF